MREAIEILRRRKKAFLIPFFVVFLIPTVWGVFFGRTYEADSVVWLDSDVSIIPLLRESAAPEQGRPIDKEAETLNQLIQSRTFLAEVLEKTAFSGELKGKGTRERALKWAGASLSAVPIGANALRIRFRGRTRTEGAMLVQAATTTFLDWAVRSSDKRNEQAIAFFAKQATQHSNALEKSRKAVQRFMERTPNAELLAQRELLLSPVRAGVSPRAQMNYERLSRVHAYRLKLYDSAMDNLARARAFAAAEHAKYAAGLRVLDPPEAPLSFSKRRLAITSGIGFLSAVLLGLLAVALAEFNDRTLRSGSDAGEALGLQVLAVVPEQAGTSRVDEEQRGHA